jgi:hypothetical protein
VPGLIEQLFRPPMGGPGLSLYINIYNTIFLYVFLAVLYAVVSLYSTREKIIFH